MPENLARSHWHVDKIAITASYANWKSFHWRFVRQVSILMIMAGAYPQADKTVTRYVKDTTLVCGKHCKSQDCRTCVPMCSQLNRADCLHAMHSSGHNIGLNQISSRHLTGSGSKCATQLAP